MPDGHSDGRRGNPNTDPDKGDPMTRILFLLILAIASSGVAAHESPAYSHDAQARTSNPDWMSRLPDTLLLSQLSIPGTHDTMSFYGGDAVQTQSMSLPDQLRSGVRVLDIRCRHVADIFAIHHGMVFQNAYFTDVLNAAIDFLAEHPGETVLMRVKEEYDPLNNTRTFEETFRTQYWDVYTKHFWDPSERLRESRLSDVSSVDNPTLGELRGKIVILQNFSASVRYGVDYNSFSIQDEYSLASNWDLYDKWLDVQAHLRLAVAGPAHTKYMNYLSGATGSFPYFVASGHSSPQTDAPRLLTGRTTPGWKNSWPDFPRVSCIVGICSIAFEGTNVLTYDRLGVEYTGRVGVVMSDFPGPGLIERVIRLNDRAVPLPASVRAAPPADRKD